MPIWHYITVMITHSARLQPSLTSRVQAVYDNIRRTEASLEEYEKKLHLFANYQAQNEAVDTLVSYARTHYPDDKALSTLLERVADQTAK